MTLKIKGHSEGHDDLIDKIIQRSRQESLPPVLHQLWSFVQEADGVTQVESIDQIEVSSQDKISDENKIQFINLLSSNLIFVLARAIDYIKKRALDFESKLKFLDSNPNIVNKYRKINKNLIIDKYNWNKVSDAYIKLLNDLRNENLDQN